MSGNEPSQQYLHEALAKLDAPTLDMHRALASLVESLQNLDGCNQRYDACTDPELKLLLAHHRDQGKKQIAMLLEWVRRRDLRMNHEMRQVMFKTGPISAPFHDETGVDAQS
jgi:hypothetical protein